MAANCTFLGEDTSIKGIVTTPEIVVEGSVKGEINARDKVYIKNGGIIEGPIRTKKILLEDGARHYGLIRLNDIDSSKPPKLEEKPEKKQQQQKTVSPPQKNDEIPNRERLW